MTRYFYSLLLAISVAFIPVSVLAQEQIASAEQGAPEADATDLLTEEEMEVLVARIALYPDELVALISGASLYPLQIVEAARFLDDYEQDNSLEAKDSWDGSVISLLNYPEIVRMMSDDLEWTQALASALAYQQTDVLIAIQQLREEAVAEGIIQSDEKMEVVEEDDNVVIKSASPEVIYVPQYDPQILYVPDYPPAPITYYPNPYPYYYSPTATFFAGAVTGAIFAAAVDWNDWGVWGGRWDGGDIKIDCNKCFNNIDIDGKIDFKDIDWKNVDRDKINIDRDQFAKFDKTEIKNKIKGDRINSIGDKAANLKKPRPSTLPAKADRSRDVRKSMQEGLKKKPGDLAAIRPGGDLKTRPNIERPKVSKPKVDRPTAKKPDKINRPSGNKKPDKISRPSGNKKPDKIKRPSGPKKPGAKVDKRPKKPSGLGNVGKGKKQKVASNRGAKSMGGGAKKRSGGKKHKSVKRGKKRR